MTDDFMTVDEVAARWRIKARSVRDEINRKRLRATKICGQWRIRPEDVADLERLNMNVPQTAKRTRPPRRRGAAA